MSTTTTKPKPVSQTEAIALAAKNYGFLLSYAVDAAERGRLPFHDIWDMAQRAFIKATTTLRSYNPLRGKITTYLKRVCHWTVADMRRGRCRPRDKYGGGLIRLCRNGDASVIPDREPDQYMGIHRDMLRLEEQELFDLAIADLTEREKQVFILGAAGWRPREVAYKLEIPQTTADDRIKRARRKVAAFAERLRLAA